MAGFWVEFTEGTDFNHITAGLKAANAQNISNNNGTWFFDAAWGTDAKSINNLRGRIETKSGPKSVSGIGVQADDSDSGD